MTRAMTRAMKRMLLILALAAAFMTCGCADDYVPHWDSDEGTCYSTLQPGCVDALIWGE